MISNQLAQTDEVQAKRRVSSYSCWTDPIWRYDHDTPGQRQSHCQIDWTALWRRDGKNLFEDGPPGLLEELRVFVDSWRNDPQEGIRMGAGSLANTQTAMRVLVEWMGDENLESVSEIDEETSWAFVDWLFQSYEVESDDAKQMGRPRELTHASALRVINLLIKIYEQRRAMRSEGVGAMTERPFGRDSTALEVVTEGMGLRRSGKLLPIPDEVALPTLTAAVRMLGQPADDILELQHIVLPIQQGLEPLITAGKKYQLNLLYRDLEKAITDYQFGTCEAESAAWCAAIAGFKPRKLLDGRKVRLSPVQQFRRLILGVVGACAVVLQGLTGMRAHELLALEVEDAEEDGTPKFLSSRLSSDGAFEIFRIDGITAKGGKRKAHWVIGARPAGSNYVPPTVRAVRMLTLLLAPWRKLGGRASLFVTFGAARGLPQRQSSIGTMLSSSLTLFQREFVHEWVEMDVPDREPHDRDWFERQIRGHRWRTTFAIHLFRIHQSLIPAIADHFKHASEVMTEYGYIGNDPSFLDAFNAVRTQFTAEVLLQMSNGSTPSAGSAARLVEQFRNELREQVGQGNGREVQERAEAFVRLHDLKISNAPHGCCLMALMPTKSRCRQMSGTAGWQHQSPDLSIRTPGVCAGCECLYVRKEHESYWRSAAQEHKNVLESAGTTSRRDELRVSARRLRLAELFVDHLASGGNVSFEDSCRNV